MSFVQNLLIIISQLFTKWKHISPRDYSSMAVLLTDHFAVDLSPRDFSPPTNSLTNRFATDRFAIVPISTSDQTESLESTLESNTLNTIHTQIFNTLNTIHIQIFNTLNNFESPILTFSIKYKTSGIARVQSRE